MQRPIRSYRGGVHVGSHMRNDHSIDKRSVDDNNDRMHMSNSNPDRIKDYPIEENISVKSKNSSLPTSMTISNDVEELIRDIDPLKVHQRKTNTNSQKADLPQLNMINGEVTIVNQRSETQQEREWFPKSNIGHVKSNDFIRHNHIESQPTDLQLAPPALLTTLPPADVLARPTAIIGQPCPTRSISTFLSSSSLLEKENCKSLDELLQNNSSKLNQQQLPLFLKPTPSSAFQPIHPIQNTLSDIIKQDTNIKAQPLIYTIPEHKPLERGQKLSKIHISHPQSPSIVHIMLDEDFNRACQLLYKMAIHPELQSDYVPSHPFKPKENDVCACFHENRWFRCRILNLSPDQSTTTVIYLDWGMVITVPMEPKYIRHLPCEFYMEPVCCIMCHLDGVSQSIDRVPPHVIEECVSLLSEHEYDIVVNDYDNINGAKIILSIEGQNVNNRIQRLILPHKFISSEDELIDQFQYQLRFSVGDEVKALLSSFSGKDDSFYILVINDNSAAIDRAINELKEHHIPNREYLQIPEVKTLVLSRYSDDKNYYRAWVKSVDLDNEQATVFFVDFGNESNVSFSDIYVCPESVRTLPWLGTRVRLINETMTAEELTTFWKLTESHYVWIRIGDVFKDAYGIEIKIDYKIYLQQERLKMITSKRSLHKCIQTQLDQKSLYPRCSSERSSCLLTPIDIVPTPIGNESLLGSLFETVNNELRALRHRIHGCNEASQDQHEQLMQLLLSLTNSYNSNHQIKD